jgi:hypothetical protein
MIVRSQREREPFVWGNANLRQASLIVFVPKDQP